MVRTIKERISMKPFTLILLLALFTTPSKSQDSITKIYDPSIDAVIQIKDAVNLAKKSNKHVLIQVGGNWCPWCIRLHKFIEEHTKIDSLINADYVYVLLNYSKENKNPKAMQTLEYPQRFGFPVLVILDSEGKRIHTQNTLYIEEGKSYSEKEIINFLRAWNRDAIDPENYK